MEQNVGIPDAVMDVLRSKGKDDRICIVGASNDPEKYGNIIVKNLTRKGYSVVPINPSGGTIEGLQAYSSLLEVPEPITMVVFVVPPRVSKKVLNDIQGRGIETVWFQDGSFDEETIDLAKQHFTNVVHDACVMVVTNYV